jgi:GT2 family glycosyltransferase
VHPTLSVLIVAWNSRAELARTLPALLPELSKGDELIVVDNDSADGTDEAVLELAPAARVLRTGRNLGFAAGCNAGAAEARGDLLVILNPDAAPLPGWGEAIRRPWLEDRGWAAWQALVADAGGTQINSAGNPVHFTGIVWAGGHGRPIAAAPAAGEVTALSGACLAIPLETWRATGGFPERFFLYHEDVDLSLRLRLRGGALGIEPAAVVDHDYEFGAREHKWRWLERNRLAFLVRAYPTTLLVLLAPALLATELALLAVSFSGGCAGCHACCASAAKSRPPAPSAPPSSPPGSPPTSTPPSSPAPPAPGRFASPCAATGASSASCSALDRLPRRPDQDLVDVDVRALFQRVDHGLGDVAVLQRPFAGAVVEEIGVGHARLDQGHLDRRVLVDLTQLAAQCLADRRRGELGRRVERARQGAPAGHGAGDQEVAVAALEQMGEGGADRQRRAVDVG